ncbi:MAG: head GIN domain-containing protein [Caldilineaceae bacterium]
MQYFAPSARDGRRFRNINRRICLLTFCLLLTITLAGCTPIIGSGHIISEERSVTGFTALELSGRGDVIITQTGAESLRVSADDNVLPLVTTQVRGKRLILGLKRDSMLWETTVRYEVTVRELSALTLSGSGDITLTKLDGNRLDVKLSGSGTISAAGHVQTLVIDLGGSGEFTGAELASQQAEANVSGSGNVVVQASDTLAANISGSGHVTYIGNPRLTSHVSGSGAISPQ